jgi:hypothetical protein
MKMNRRVLLFVTLVMAGCSARPAANAGGSTANMRLTVAPLALEPPPVYALIGYRDKLKLTSEQVTTLDSIATGVRAQNATLIDSLQAKGITNNRAPGLLQINPTERPLLEQIRTNNKDVLDRVAGVLSPEQETEVCTLYEVDQRDTRGPGGQRRQPALDPYGRTNPAALRADSSLVVRGFSVWPWCQNSAASRDSTAAPRGRGRGR